MNSCARNSLFTSSFPKCARLKDVRGTQDVSIKRCWYLEMEHLIRSTI